MKLEKAALRIASGDLETAVQLRGIREMASLAETMDGMRKTLLEGKDRRARFLAAVSHDLRTPLTSIGGYLEAVEDGLADDPETLARYVEIMLAKTSLLEDRIQGLIEFERMETGEWRMGFKPLALGPFLDRLSREFAEDAKLRGLGFESDLSCLAAGSGASGATVASGALAGDAGPGAGGGPVIQADEALLCRAIENIVSNAFKHSPEGGSVRISAARVGSLLCIDVDDEGPGIPSTERELVFEPFYRGRPSRPLPRDGEEGGAAASASEQGNGLGLYIARSVIRGHGWDLRVEDSPSGGARLSIVIPWGRHA
jgi:signal transduction histidine kinase